MLGRSANGIFWIFRYLERAENYARLIDTGFRMAMTRDIVTAEEEWRSVIDTAGMSQHYGARNGTYTGQQVWNFILREKENPNSIRSLIAQVRNNARSVRNVITSELWEAINESYLHTNEMLSRPVSQSALVEVIAAIKRQATQVRGAMSGSMLRNDIYSFGRIGQFLERADSTARILDVKYYLLLPSLSLVGSNLDNAQWETILRSLGAERAYRWLNAGNLNSQKITSFLVLDERFPRSLRFCFDSIREELAEIALEYGEETSAHAIMRDADLKLQDRSIGSIVDQGLHEFLTDFTIDVANIADAIQREYRFYA